MLQNIFRYKDYKMAKKWREFPPADLNSQHLTVFPFAKRNYVLLLNSNRLS